MATFHRFIYLPYDIRYSIYILATPPRIVRLEEGPIDPKEKHLWFQTHASYFECEYEKFCEELILEGGSPPNPNFKLHPDIAHFAHNWKHQLNWPSKQPSLEAYGFTSSRPAHEPWKPTQDTPRIPTEWLIDSPELAFVLTRKSCLWSITKIPKFLHVCVESRQALMEWGYRLFFSTRTAGPRTWFNPARDHLYIPFRSEEFPSRTPGEHVSDQLPPNPYPTIQPTELLSGSSWDIGLYSVQDLKVIEKVILGSPNFFDDNILIRYIERLLPLLSDAKELFLEDCSANHFEDWFEDTHGAPIWSFTRKSPSHCILVEDMDVVGSIFWSSKQYMRRMRHCYTGPFGDSFCPFKAPSPGCSHAMRAIYLESRLREWKYTSKLAQRVGVRIPTIRHVNLVPDPCVDFYVNSRHGLFEALRSLSDLEITRPDFRQWFPAVNVFPPPFSIQCGSDEENRLGWIELLNEMQHRVGEATVPGVDQLQAWYVLNRFWITEPQSTSLSIGNTRRF